MYLEHNFPKELEYDIYYLSPDAFSYISFDKRPIVSAHIMRILAWILDEHFYNHKIVQS